jgi:alkaline phosphatase D
MVWNGAVRPGKDDHWGAYPAEFGGLCHFLGAESIEGVVLLGGDIHRSRVVVHATAERVGYDLPELISSPMHGRVIESANVPHPGLRFDSGEGHIVCIVAADAQELRAIFQTPDAILHTEVIARSSLLKPR